MQMKKMDIIILTILVIILLIATVALIVLNTSNPKNEQTNGESNYTETNTKDYAILSEVKKIEGLDISNIQVTYVEGVSKVVVDVSNNTRKTVNLFEVKFSFYDKEGTNISNINTIIKKLEPGQTTTINMTTNIDIRDAYSYTVTKK